jgi:long-chain acyl-CoA synthetase
VRESSVPVMVELPDTANLTDAPAGHAAEQPDHVLFRCKNDDGDGWRPVSATTFWSEVVGLAKGLVAAGIGQGDRVALMSRTRYEWTLIDYAIWAAGAVTVPIYDTSSAEQIEWIISDSGAKAAFVENEKHEATVESVRAALTGYTETWRVEGADIAALTERGATLGDDVIAERRAAVGIDDLATIIYTSGTTGRPKGCEITHGNLLRTAKNAHEGALREIVDLDGGSTLLFLPLAHVFARFIQVLCMEAAVTLGHTPDIADVVPDLESFRPTFLLAVPRVFEKVYNGAEQKATADGKGKIFQIAAATAVDYSRALDSGGPGLPLRLRHLLFDKLVYVKLRAAIGGQVTYAVAGGSALGERLGHFFRGVGITILEGYGLTETTAPATVNMPSQIKIGTVGRPLPGVTVRIADDGEVLVKGVNVLRGYWHNEGATKEALEDGWLRTGDLGSLDDDGFLKITGRKKEILITAAGKNVAPAPLEDRLRAHALVSQCLVVGDGKPFIGALVTLDPDAIGPWAKANGKPEDMTVAQAREDADVIAAIDSAVQSANASVSRAESIKKYRILGEDLTEESGHLTPSLKIKRNVVMRDYAAEVEAMYAK